MRLAQPCALKAATAVVALTATLAFRTAVADDTRDQTDVANEAKNLARLNCGSRIDWISPNEHKLVSVSGNTQTAAEGLILDDQTLNVRLPQGDNIFVVTLQQISLLGRFSFINEQGAAAGKVEVFVSNFRLPANDPRWQGTNRNFSFSDRRFVQISLLGVEAKYVKLAFHVEKEGTIAGLGLYGQKTLQSFAEQHRRARKGELNEAYVGTNSPGHDGLNFNFANIYAKAQIVYVSSGSMDSVHRMIDDDPATEFAFSATDAHPTVMVELAENQRLRRISAVYEMEAGQLDIYLFNTMPEDKSDFGARKPVVTITDQTGTGKAAADFDPKGARYVALRWTPNESHSGHKTFKIAEIGAFGDMSFAILDLETFPERVAETSGVPIVPFEPPPVTPVSP